MRISIFVTSLLLVCQQRQAQAVTVELPLPELTGEFAGRSGVSRSTNVNMETPPDSVQHVWIRLIGVAVPGLAECMLGPEEVPWPADLSVGTWDAVSRGWWIAGTLVPEPAEIGVPRSFDVTLEFHPVFGATWETLMTGRFTVDLHAAPPGLIGVCSGVTPPHGTVTEVRLIIEGVFPSPVSPSTWGRLKSLWPE